MGDTIDNGFRFFKRQKLPQFYPVLIKIAPECMVCKDLSSWIHSLPMLPVALTLKAPRKTASENVVCLCRLLNILALFKPIFAYRQTVWTQIRLLLKEQSDLGPHCLQK